MNGESWNRWALYGLLITVAAGMMLARVARLRSPDPKIPTPFLSANDRSRWATIRALGDDGTYAIDHIIFDERGNRVRGWHTIDLVRHRGRDGREHYYSSKPTLLTTLLAGEYWLIKTITGATLAEQPYYVSRLMLVLTNVLPIAAALVLLARLIDQLSTTDWTRAFAVAAACFGTFVTTFASTLNNHVTAAVSLIFALTISLPIWRDGRLEWWRFAFAGLCFAFAAANELPALALLVLVSLGFAWKSPLRTLLAFVPAAVFVAACALGTNILAHGDWRTPYAHRQDGPRIGKISSRFAEVLNTREFPPELRSALEKADLSIKSDDRISLSAAAFVEVLNPNRRWKIWDAETQTELALVRSESFGSDAIHIYYWDNWYDYEGSYWRPENLRGVDRGEASPWRYALHVLVGHHGIFSLTPVWILSAFGCGMWLQRRRSPEGQALAALTVLTTVVVVGFYLTRPEIDRNYGGVSCCLRWLIWMTPLWLLALLPAADWLSRPWWCRVAALVLLGLSVFSASYAADNPWSHPWLFDYWTSLGWTKY